LNSYPVSYFGLLAERRGISCETVASNAHTPSALYAELDAAHHFGLATGNFRVAVNDEFVSWDHALGAGDHVALLPPMSGG
jgi:molybdopterin converting factor small subunit